MSRIGKKEINVPTGVNIKITPEFVGISGPKGDLSVPYKKSMIIKHDGDVITVNRESNSRTDRSLHGTTRQLIANSILGVSEGYSKILEIKGVGYQANMQGNYLVLQLGFSHDIYFEPPDSIDIQTKKTTLTVSGIDKQLVGEVAAKIRSFRRPEPYKGKGIRYKGEFVRIKQGKTVGSN